MKESAHYFHCSHHFHCCCCCFPRVPVGSSAMFLSWITLWSYYYLCYCRHFQPLAELETCILSRLSYHRRFGRVLRTNVLLGSFQALAVVAVDDVDCCSCFGHCMKFPAAGFDCCSSPSNLRKEKQRLKKKRKKRKQTLVSMRRFYYFSSCTGGKSKKSNTYGRKVKRKKPWVVLGMSLFLWNASYMP